LGDKMTDRSETSADLSSVLDLRLRLSLELGRRKVTLAELKSIQSGSILELDVKAGEALNLVANGAPVAQGEVVILEQGYGFRLTRVYSPAERGALR